MDKRPLHKPDDVLDRDRLWHRLVAASRTAKPELLLVLGRRRAGKSYLLTRFVEAVGGIYYQATKQTEREQLRTLSRMLALRFNDAALKHTVFERWDMLLDYLVDQATTGPFTIVLDEFPYLVESSPALPSVLQSWWDHKLVGTQLTVVLSGSHVSAMKRLVESDQPLFGRRTGRLEVRPFDYYDAAQFVRQWSAKDKLALYGVFGGLPGHLALVDPSKSFVENAARHVLDQSGRLHDEAIHAFDTFVAQARVHYSIIEAIANGEQRWNRISSRIGKQTSTLARPLDWLIDMEVVERFAPITEYPHPSPKRVLYRLSDPYLRFWYRFVADIKGGGFSALVAPEMLWKRFVEPHFEAYLASIFEDVCRQYVARGPHNRLPFESLQVGSWWNTDSTEEVDVVAWDGKGGLLIGECKWGTVTGRHLDVLKRRAATIAAVFGDIQEITLVLFSAGGWDQTSLGARLKAGEALHIGVEALYEGG